MKKRIINLLTGFFVSFGKTMTFFIIVALIINKELINYENIIFLLSINIMGWVLGLMYDLDWNTKIITTIHSIIFYLGYAGLITIIYSKDALFNNLVLLTGIYIFCYIAMYLAVIHYNKKLNVSLNNTIDYIKEYEDKF